MRRRMRQGVCVLLLSATAGLMCACSRDAPTAKAGTADAAVQRLHDACVLAMVQDTCRVTNDRSSTSSVPLVEQVFVAGVGPVDAQAYRAIRASGEAMCSIVRQSCLADWDGAQCRTARSLWPESAEARVPAGVAR